MLIGGLGGAIGSASDSRSEGLEFESLRCLRGVTECGRWASRVNPSLLRRAPEIDRRRGRQLVQYGYFVLFDRSSECC